MKTIETTIEVDVGHRATIQLPADISPGVHPVVMVIDEQTVARPASRSLTDFPVIDVGPWPEGLSLRREDMYGDDGR
jgi:hypothetical protein